MDPEDEEAIAFHTLIEIFCYRVMPLGLKNVGATYQRAMTYIFEDLLHDVVECYVDDLIIKTKLRQHHIIDVDQVFQRLCRYNLKMNPLKCAFGVSSVRFLGFVVRHRRIEIDLKKITTKVVLGLCIVNVHAQNKVSTCTSHVYRTL